MTQASPDVAIVGGGVIGLAIALELARRRAGRICVFDHGSLGGESSPAAAGLLTVAGQRAPGGVLLRMCRRSAAMYDAFLEYAAERGGRRLEVDRCGLVLCARDEAERAAYAVRVAHRRREGIAAEMLDRRDLESLLPGLAAEITSAAHYPEDGRIDPPLLLVALREALASSEVSIRRSYVTDIVTEGARVIAVDTCDGRIAVGVLVIAAGYWATGLTRRLGATLPLRASRGEMLALRFASPAAIVGAGDTTVIPQAPDTVWIGATVEPGDDPNPTPSGYDVLRRRAAAILPAMASAEVLAHWAGIRPRSILLRPIVDRVPGIANAFVATGHHRQGFLLAPLTAAAVTSLVLDETPPMPLEPWSWRRRRDRPRPNR